MKKLKKSYFKKQMKMHRIEKNKISFVRIIPDWKSAFIFLTFYLFPAFSLAQYHQGTNISGSFGKLIDIPVSAHTGTPLIQIPMGTIEEGPLRVPFGLQYHSTGPKAGELAGDPGLGFQFFGGGAIFRQRKHLLDEDNRDGRKGYYLHGGDLTVVTTHRTEVENNTRDGEKDIFTFYMPGYQGQFEFSGGDGVNPSEVILVPQQDLQVEVTDIECPGSSSFCYIRGFVITDPFGTKYYFGKYEPNAFFAVERTINSNLPLLDPTRDYASAWFIAKIETYDQKNVIEYKYLTSNYKYESLAPSELKVTHVTNGGTTQQAIPVPNTLVLGGTQIHYQTMEVFSKVLDSIKTLTQIIEFDHMTRTDVSVFGSDLRRAISGVKIHEGVGHCKQYAFTQSYFTDGSGMNDPWRKRLKLDAVTLKSCDNTQSIPSYSFTYLNPNGLPPRLTKGLDHYGGYNGKTANNNLSTLIPNTTYVSPNNQTTFSYGNANRDVDTTYAKRGLLTKITLPTGGYHEYIWEANRALDPNAQGDKTSIKYLEAGRTSPASSCTPSTHTASYSTTLSSSQITNGHFVYGISSHFGDCAGNTTLVRLEVLQNNVVKILEEFNYDGPFQMGPVALAGHGLSSSTSTTFRLTVNNEGRGFADIYYYQTVPDDVVAGGFRIKQTTAHDGFDTSRDIIKNYKYRKSFTDNKSSGVYIGRPLYGDVVRSYGTPVTYELMAEPFSLAPLTSFEGYHIGYTRVEIEHNGNGTTVQTFKTEDFNHTPGYPSTGLQARVLAGSHDSTAILDSGDNLVSYDRSVEKNDFYQNLGGINIRLKKITGIPTNYTYKVYNNVTRNYFRPDTTVNYLDGVEVKSDYVYGNNYFLGPTQIRFNDSKGFVVSSKIAYLSSYAHDAELKDYFIDHHMIGVPYEQKKNVSTYDLDGTRTLWSAFNNTSGSPQSDTSNAFPYPRYSQALETDYSGTPFIVDWRSLTEYLQYDMRYGFATQSRDDGWKINYSIYDDLGNMTTDSFENYVNKYEFFPGSSLPKSSTGVDGQKVSYSYDALIRRKTIMDECTGTLTTFNYKFNDSNNNGYNWVSEKKDYVPVPGSAVDEIENITYLDGLYREVQTVGKNHSQTSNRDVIYARDYDNQGRVNRAYEPFHSTLTTGKYVSITSSHDHTLNEYEASPLNRIKKVTPPSWYPTEYFYETNGGGEVAGYLAGRLRKTKIKDGNGHYSISFTDKRGRTIYQGRADQNEGSVVATSFSFDGRDRPITVTPPGGASHAELKYSYTYDVRDNILTKKIPGKGLIKYLYNDRNQLAYMQDANLLAQNKWYAWQYDDYGRETKSGFFTGTPAVNLSFGQAQITEALTEDIYGASGTHEVDKPVTLKSKILGTSSWLQTDLDYSTCGFMTGSSGNSFVNLSAGSETHTYTHDWMGSVLSDDYTHIGPAGTKTISHERTYDHIGRPDLYKHGLNGGALKTLSDVNYDHEEQLTKLTLGGISSAALDFSYLDNGLLSKINDAGLANGDVFYQELVYDDDAIFVSAPDMAPPQKNGTVAGTLTQVLGHDRIGFGLEYDYLDRFTRANNIEYNSSGSIKSYGKYRMTGITYDARGNRQSMKRELRYRDGNTFVEGMVDDLTYNYAANSNQLDSVSDDASAGLAHHGYNPDGQAYAYDANGNVTYDPGSSTTFTYNHLDLPTSADLGDGKTINWTYDARGGMLQKLVKKDNTVLENHRYVGQIEYGGNQIEMIYHDVGRIYNKNFDPAHIDLDGIITGTETAYGATISSTALIESGSTVDFVAEDCIELNENFTVDGGTTFTATFGSGPTGEDWRYDYFVQDHLGNARVVFSDLDNSNGISASEILAEYNYQPGGFRIDGDWGENTYLNNEKYQYNSIEYVEDHGLDLSMATYRMLDSKIGRWLGVDPRAELLYGHTPYNSMNNNPISYSDPEGDLPILVPIIAAVVGGGINVAANWKNINSFGDGLAAFGIGAGAAVAGVFAAPAAAVGATAGATIGSFAAAGAVGGAVGGLVEGTGNALYFGDANLGDALGQGLVHGVIGGIGGAALGAATGAIAHRPARAAISSRLGQGGGELIDGHNVVGTSTVRSSNFDDGVAFGVSREITVSAPKAGTFSISNWAGYPAGISRPTGPFRLLQGKEYGAARRLADRTNRTLRDHFGIKGNPNWEIHEIHPVKFGGSPTSLANKMVLPRGFHRGRLTPWWNGLQRALERTP